MEEITRAVIVNATRQRRFVARAARCDSTVVEADIRHLTDIGLAVAATGVLARAAQWHNADVNSPRERGRPAAIFAHSILAVCERSR